MAKLALARGTTDFLTHVFIQDASQTDGRGLASLAHNTSGLVCRKIRPGEAAPTSVTLENITTIGTYQAPTSNAHLRFKAIDDTEMPGWYELHLHNDWLDATNARRSLGVLLRGAANMAPLPVEIQLEPLTLAAAYDAAKTAAQAGDAMGLTTEALDDVQAVTIQSYRRGVAVPAFKFVLYDAAGSPAPGLTVSAFRLLTVSAGWEPCENAVSEVTGPPGGGYVIDLAAEDTDSADNDMLLAFAATGARTLMFKIPLVD